MAQCSEIVTALQRLLDAGIDLPVVAVGPDWADFDPAWMVTTLAGRTVLALDVRYAAPR